MNYKFYFKKRPQFTHVVMYSGLAGWYNMEESLLIDFETCVYNLQEESEDGIIDIMIYHLNLAFVHSMIDKQMFFGECKKEGWDPKYTWNQGLILGQGMGDLDEHEFKQLFPEKCEKHEEGRIMRELDPYTGRHRRPTHYYKKQKKVKKVPVYRHTKYKIDPPSHIPNYSEHDCRAEECWQKTYCEQCQDYCRKICPYVIPQYCMVCDEPSFFGYSLDYERRVSVTTMPFWVCDKHLYDNNLEDILKKGIPLKFAKDDKKLIQYVKKELDKKLI